MPDADKTIIYITAHRNLYGAERSLLSMMRGAREKGYRPVLIMGGNGDIETELRKEKMEYLIHPFCQWINMDGRRNLYIGVKCLVKNIIFAHQLAKRLRTIYPGIIIVHTNSIITDFGLHLARELKVPHIFHIREFGKLDFQMSFNLGEQLSARMINKSAKVICISEAVKAYYADIIENKKLIRVYNGISIPTDTCRHQKDGKCRFILVGRISREKGQETVIQAVRLIHSAPIEVDFYGNGADEEKLKKMTDEMGLSDRIHFMGYQTIIPYENYDAAIMASTAEAFGRVTVEYMLHSLPVIGADTGATAELIDNGETGVLFEMGNIWQLAANMKKFMEDSELREAMGKKARAKALAEFTEEKYWNNIIQIYHDVENMRK